MTETVRWWWIRHAPVDSGGRIYGSEDPPCDCSDSALFESVAQRLPREAVWVTTHLQRTHQTAEAFMARLDPRPGPPLIEPRFGEQSFGEWHGLTHDELRAQRHPEWHRFWHAPAIERPPGGESFVELMERVRGGMAELTGRHPGRDLVSVAHGGTIRAALAVALALDPEAALRFAVDNCSLTRMDWIPGASGSHAPEEPGAWRVSLVNFPPRSAA